MLLTQTQNERVRSEAKELLRRDWHGSMTGLANHLGLSQSQISQFLGGKTGAGMKLLKALSFRTGKPIDVILGKQAPDLEERVSELEDEIRNLQKEKDALTQALRAFVELAAKYKRAL